MWCKLLGVFPNRKVAREFETGLIARGHEAGRVFNQILPDGTPLDRVAELKAKADLQSRRQERKVAERRAYWQRVREGKIEAPLDWKDGRIVPTEWTDPLAAEA